MKRLYLFLFASITLGLEVHGAVPSYTNPILPYDYSDPDVCRVGDTYNVPGLQILASKDLVHWEIVDAAIRYRLPGYKEGDKVAGNFVWAPAIREHDGRIWIYYGDPDRGIYCVRSKAISYQNSEISFPLEWEEPVLVMPAKGYIDPCPLWDEDGRVWLSHGVAGSRYGLKSVLMMAELTADGLAVKTPSRIIFDGHEEHPTSEGTKLYKRNGYYYIMHPRSLRTESDAGARQNRRQCAAPGRMGGDARRRGILHAFSGCRRGRTHRASATLEMGERLARNGQQRRTRHGN